MASECHAEFVFVTRWPGDVQLSFRRVAGSDRSPCRLHLDFVQAAGDCETEAERLFASGPPGIDVIGEVLWIDRTTLTDPEGDLFCVDAPPA